MDRQTEANWNYSRHHKLGRQEMVLAQLDEEPATGECHNEYFIIWHLPHCKTLSASYSPVPLRSVQNLWGRDWGPTSVHPHEPLAVQFPAQCSINKIVHVTLKTLYLFDLLWMFNEVVNSHIHLKNWDTCLNIVVHSHLRKMGWATLNFN